MRTALQTLIAVLALLAVCLPGALDGQHRVERDVVYRWHYGVTPVGNHVQGHRAGVGVGGGDADIVFADARCFPDFLPRFPGNLFGDIDDIHGAEGEEFVQNEGRCHQGIVSPCSNLTGRPECLLIRSTHTAGRLIPPETNRRRGFTSFLICLRW